MGYVPLSGLEHAEIRRTTRADLEPLLTFFRGLSPGDRRYLRKDVIDPEVVAGLLREAERGGADRIIAVHGDRVVGMGALLFEEEVWHRHLGGIRVLVAEDHRGRRLGANLVSELVELARGRGVSQVVAKMPGAQERVRGMFKRLGFRVDAVLPGHVLDAEGKVQDLVVMSCSLDEVSAALREFCRDDDWADG